MGTLAGTTVFPVLGSILGGVLGAGATAFLYELARTGLQRNAAHLAWEAAKMRFLAVLGKICAGIALAMLFIRQVFFYFYFIYEVKKWSLLLHTIILTFLIWIKA